MRPFRIAWRRSWFYRFLLKGKMPDRVLYYPQDSCSRRLEEADALLRGRFRFGSEVVDIRDGSVFDKKAPSAQWSEALNGFDWLPPLSAAGGEASRTLATNLITQWVRRNARYSEPAWLPQVTARRLVHLFSDGKLVLANSDVMWRSKFFVSMREQSRLLARTAKAAPDGLPRFEAAAALVLSGVCLDDSGKRLQIGLARLIAEISRQILPDGGHASRSPETLLNAYRHIAMVVEVLEATGHQVPSEIRSAHDRMAPMLRFFRLGDGALALFNGGRECDARMIEDVLNRDEVRGQPFVYAPHSGFQRLAAGKSLVVMDCGTVPKGVFSNEAHAGCLSFEFSAGAQRLVVNCGSAGSEQWNGVLRATAAHSTIALADTSMAAVLSPGLARNLIGARMFDGPTKVETFRQETANGWSVDAKHDGYVDSFGIVHERRIWLAPRGESLTGSDRLVPSGRGKRGETPFAVRFHIHPDVRVSPSQGGDILLKLPGGEGWRFRAGGGVSTVEESIYLGGETTRRAEQLVVAGGVGDEPVEIAWAFEQIGAA
jgi:uncharacterized heparinase superfamily protein